MVDIDTLEEEVAPFHPLEAEGAVDLAVLRRLAPLERPRTHVRVEVPQARVGWRRLRRNSRIVARLVGHVRPPWLSQPVVHAISGSVMIDPSDRAGYLYISDSRPVIGHPARS